MTSTSTGLPTRMSEPNERRSTRMIWVIVAAVVVAAGTALALWAWFAPPNVSRYEPVIQRLASGALEPDTVGRIDLSHDFPGLVPQDQIWAIRRTDSSFIALFPMRYGKGTSMLAILYTSRPLRLEETYARPMATTLDRRMIDVAAWTRLVLDK